MTMVDATARGAYHHHVAYHKLTVARSLSPDYTIFSKVLHVLRTLGVTHDYFSFKSLVLLL